MSSFDTLDNSNDDEILSLEEQNKIFLLQNKSADSDIIDEITHAKYELKEATRDLLKAEMKIVQVVNKVEEERNKLISQSEKSCSSMNDNGDDMEFHGKMVETQNKLIESEIQLYLAQTQLDTSKSRYEAAFSIFRRLGLSPFVTINNISGKNAWVILSPAPIQVINSIGLDKIGQVGVSMIGELKCQQSVILNNTTIDFELDNSQIYYTVFFDCDGKWKVPFKDKRVNTRKYNINLLEKHVQMAYYSESLPV